ncbi:MAG: ferritin-like domain-containing protein [Ilumatobacteraceae bacterium]
MENPTRRRVLVAGLTGTALGLIGGRTALAGTTPPSTDETDTESSGSGPTTTEPPGRPTAEDTDTLVFAQGVELTAQDLYQAALDTGADNPVLMLMRDNHRAYAQIIGGILGTKATGERDEALYRDLEPSFAKADFSAVVGPAYDLESTLVASHTELLRLLQGVDGAKVIASILIVEARQGTVLADAAGMGDDFDALFINDASPITMSGARGG